MGNTTSSITSLPSGLSGGFTVDDGCHRALDQQATRLGFADLRGCLQALLEDGWSIPRLATQAWALRQVEGELGAALSLCGGCWTSTRSGGWRRPGGSEPLPQRPGALSSRRGRSSNAATHA